MGPSCMWGNRNQGRPSLFHCRPWTSKALESTASGSPPTWTLLASQAELLTDYIFLCLLLSPQLSAARRWQGGGWWICILPSHIHYPNTHTHTYTYAHTAHIYTYKHTYTYTYTSHTHIHRHIHICAQSLQSRPTICDPISILLGSLVHGIIMARLLEWVPTASSRRSSRPRDGTWVSCGSCICRWILYHEVTWEVHMHINTHRYGHIHTSIHTHK